MLLAKRGGGRGVGLHSTHIILSSYGQKEGANQLIRRSSAQALLRSDPPQILRPFTTHGQVHCRNQTRDCNNIHGQHRIINLPIWYPPGKSCAELTSRISQRIFIDIHIVMSNRQFSAGKMKGVGAGRDMSTRSVKFSRLSAVVDQAVNQSSRTKMQMHRSRSSLASLNTSDLRLHGRENDMDMLLGKLRNIDNLKDEIIMVSGSSGCGKSSLVMRGENGYWILL